MADPCRGPRFRKGYEHQEVVAAMDGYSVDLAGTNMAHINIPGRTAADIVTALAGHGVDVMALGPDLLLLVIHLHITADDIDRAIEAFAATV